MRQFHFQFRIVESLSLQDDAVVLSKLGRLAGQDDLRTIAVQRAFPAVDDEIELVVAPISLQCPLRMQRMVNPYYTLDCEGYGSFELSAFLELGTRSKKWCCPHCYKPAPTHLGRVVEDRYLRRILELLGTAGEHILEIEIDREGQWRPSGWAQWFTLENGPAQEDLLRAAAQ